MTNTKFRKRALLSSVAMLLVALVALGSATFAWFAESPNVDASGLSVKTTASDGLEIMADQQNTWGTSATLNYNNASSAFNLTPVSQVQNDGTTYHGDTFYTVKANAPGNYASGSNVIEGASSGTYFKEDLFFRLTQTSAATASRNVVLTGITITKDANNNNDLADAVRVALVDADNKILGTYALSTSTKHGTLPYGSDGKTVGETASENVVVPVEFSPTLATSVASAVPVVSGVTPNSAKTGTDVKKVSVYVWLDGQDGNCFTTNVESVDVAAILSGITLNFSLAA